MLKEAESLLALEPDDNNRLANLCGQFDENLRYIETNISVNHTIVINNVWPRSGWEIKRSITGTRTMPLNKYL